MVPGVICYKEWIRVKSLNPLVEAFLEVVQLRICAVGQSFVDQRKEPFRRLEFGRIGRKEDEVDA
jgi:hypothetical protein